MAELTYREKLGHKPYADPGVDCQKAIKEGRDQILVEQQHKEDCDLNVIVERYVRDGTLPDNHKRTVPYYGDFTKPMDYLTAKEQLKRAEEAFMALGAEVRKRFDNSPAKLIEFLADKKNLDEAIKLGLVEPKKPADSTLSGGKAPAATSGEPPKGAGSAPTPT
jgi:phage internal scaffolding protein